MIPASDSLARVVAEGGFRREFVADLVVDGERVLSDVVLPQCEVTSKRSQRVRTQGTATFTYSDELGQSMVPKDLTSWLTPYASVLSLSYRVQVGDFVEKVPQGLLRIVSVRDPRESSVSFQGRMVTVGSKVGLSLADAFRVTDRERFVVPGSPSQLDSVWQEIAQVTGLPVLQNVADVPITRSVAYQENRLDAVADLATLLGGIPYVDHAGRVTIDPDVWPSVTAELSVGADGTVVDVTPATLTDEGIFNQVVVRSHDDGQALVLATRELEGGPLRYGGPFGRIPYFASSQFVTTEEQAGDYAASLLPQVSSQPAAEFAVQCIPDPRLTVGDVVAFPYQGKDLAGRIVERTLASSGPMSLTLQVRQ